MDLLLDINVAVDICCKRQPFIKDADLAVSQCLYQGGRLWLYAGSVQTLEYVTRSELRRSQASPGVSITARQPYLNKPAGSYPVAEELAKRVMSLPMSPELSFIDQQKIVGVLSETTAELEANA